MKKILCAGILLGIFALAGCGQKEQTMELKAFYDDRIALSSIASDVTEAVIEEQQVTSKQVGTQNADAAVLTLVGDQLIATGVGTATVKAGNVVCKVTVEPAPISLFMITGHSMGAGTEGTADQSVVCPDGQVYSTHGRTLQQTPSDTTGIGYGSTNKMKNIDAFVKGGGGTVGEGSGFAYRWNQLTGEKVWVLNTALGGSTLPEWIPGTANYQSAVTVFTAAQKVLTNEIAAGHYVLKDMALIYHCGANFVNAAINKNYQYTQEDLDKWYDQMWSGFQSAFSLDMDGDGKEETVTSLGIVPIWRTWDVGKIDTDMPAAFYMSTSQEYPEFFIASTIGKKWREGDEMVVQYFPEPEYEAHIGKHKKPTKVDQVIVDGTHYYQVGYNAVGMDIAENMYTYLRQPEKVTELTLVDTKDTPIPDNCTMQVGDTLMIVPMAKEITAGNLEYRCSGSVSLSYPCLVTANAQGEGVLEVLQDGQVIKTVKFTVG